MRNMHIIRLHAYCSTWYTYVRFHCVRRFSDVFWVVFLALETSLHAKEIQPNSNELRSEMSNHCSIPGSEPCCDYCGVVVVVVVDGCCWLFFPRTAKQCLARANVPYPHLAAAAALARSLLTASLFSSVVVVRGLHAGGD